MEASGVEPGERRVRATKTALASTVGEQGVRWVMRGRKWRMKVGPRGSSYHGQAPAHVRR